MESEWHGYPKVIKAWETTHAFLGACQIFDCQQYVLQVEKGLEHEVIEAVLTKEAQTLLRTSDKEENLHGDHWQILS
jgi:hypothetical protein